MKDVSKFFKVGWSPMLKKTHHKLVGELSSSHVLYETSAQAQSQFRYGALLNIISSLRWAVYPYVTNQERFLK